MCKRYLFIVAVICGVIGGSVFPNYQENMDINNDGIIDVCDVQILVSAIISDNLGTLPDINTDGKIDVKDLQILLKNMGKKQKSTNPRTELYSSLPKTNSSNYQQIKKVNINSLIKYYLMVSDIKVFKEEARKLEKWCNYDFSKLYGQKYLAYRISPNSPPIH